MYNILVYCDKKNREVIIPEFKKYFSYLDVQLSRHLNYSSIKNIVRKNIEDINSVFLLNVSKEGLKIEGILQESKEIPSSSFLFTEEKLVINYKEFTPFDKILSIIFEMSDLTIERKKVEEITDEYNFGILNGKLIYHDDFGKTITKETEKTLQTFFKENCFSNLFRIKF